MYGAVECGVAGVDRGSGAEGADPVPGELSEWRDVAVAVPASWDEHVLGSAHRYAAVLVHLMPRVVMGHRTAGEGDCFDSLILLNA